MSAWRCLFHNEEHLESRVFPPLHKVVLGLVSLDLHMQVALHTASIDAKDADGRTALSWAATRGDLRSVSLLLDYGADPNVASLRGQTSLHWASQNPALPSANVLRALIGAGAVMNQTDYWGRTALDYASCNQDDTRCLEVLVSCGAKLNSQDCHQRTALGYAARMGKFKAVEYLLSSGANAGLVDIWGFPPLFECLRHNHHRCLRILLQHGPVPICADINGMSALHIAALYSNVETLNVFAEHGLDQVDIKSLNHDGMTAQDLFNRRPDLTPGHKDAFLRLTLKHRACAVASIFPRSPEGDLPEVDEEVLLDERFEDAKEYLNDLDT